MKLLHGIFSTRKDLESSFHRYGGHMKLVHATSSVRKAIQKNLHNYGGPGSSCMPVCMSGGTLIAVFTTVLIL